MAYAKVYSAAIDGIDVELITVEVDVSNGLPSFSMVGYLSSEVREAAERVRSALINQGFAFPVKRIIANLSPAQVKKRGSAFDLPIAVAILQANEVLTIDHTKEVMLVGELSLEGQVLAVPGVFPTLLKAQEAKVKKVYIPKANASEASLFETIDTIAVSSLREVVEDLLHPQHRTPPLRTIPSIHRQSTLDFEDVRGQESVKRAAEIAVAGLHNLLMIGPPGSGKTMIAKRIPSILPQLQGEKALEVMKIHSIMGLLDPTVPLMQLPPFREVHHGTTATALVGGGRMPKPGEVTLAHGGVLYLDELPEFQRAAIEALREPLEAKEIMINRNGGSYCFPADFILVAAMNPCPCGMYPDMRKCSCTPSQIQSYHYKLSKAFLDRIDLAVTTQKLSFSELLPNAKGKDSSQGNATTSAKMRMRVERARQYQAKRYNDLFPDRNVIYNGKLSMKELDAICVTEEGCTPIMEQAFTRLDLSARSYHRIRKVARTIADLEESPMIRKEHLLEAIGYRMEQGGVL